MTVTESAVSDKYNILSRRVLVRHKGVDPVTGIEKLTEGWASVQSSEGYVILSPLSSLCYTNTRWGSTRPVIRQCGHAAHSNCVEQHILSLHSRAAGDQPYDGRFAANIDDGEFLCPLCKQLSNILIPRDGCARELENLKSTGEGPNKAVPLSKELQQPSSPHWSQLRTFLTKEVIVEEDKNEVGRKALDEFGSHLYQAMKAPWERVSAAKKRKQRLWDPAIQQWDYEDKEDDESSTGTGPILRLLRQQHIAWASVGHSAAAAEAGARGVEQVLSFGVFSQTSDPWIDYGPKVKDSHPLLLELRRTLTATSSLLDVVVFEINKRLRRGNPTRSANVSHVVGSSLASILEGRSWMHQIVSASNGEKNDKELISQLSQVTALMASIPCHVARDGMISQRHEARAAAVAMWIMKGIGTKYTEDDRLALTEPPVPYAIRQVYSQASGDLSEIPEGWGTMDPFVSPSSFEAKYSELERSLPFRPGAASAFLYIPLLAWDLNTLAGAVYSTMLANDVDCALTSGDLLIAARMLLFGRLVQVIITPGGYETSLDVDDDELLDNWTGERLKTEKLSLAKIVSHCRQVVKSQSLDVGTDSDIKLDDSELNLLLSGIGSAILPFARSLILLLRASISAVRQRQRKNATESDDEATPDDKLLDSLLGNPETMSCEDGFLLLKGLGGPLPSHITSEVETSVDGDSWWSLMNRWLLSAVGLELHHGSRDTSVISAAASNTVPFSGNGEPLEMTMNNEDAHDSVSQPGSGDTQNEESADDIRRAEIQADLDVDDVDESEAEEIEDQDMVELDIVEHNEIRMIFNNQNALMDDELADSDEDLMDIDDGEEEMVDFVEPPLGIARVSRTQHPLHSMTSDLLDDTSDDNSDGNSSGMSEKERDVDGKFAGVSRSAIIPYQPSLLGLVDIGMGKRGSPFDFVSASKVMRDLSHLGMIHRKGTPTKCLIRLPKSFVELYSLVNRVRGRDESSIADDADDASSSETAICLLTGAVMRSGSPRRPYTRPVSLRVNVECGTCFSLADNVVLPTPDVQTRPPGSCTLHARQVGSGTGIFFLVQKCTVLLMHNNKSAYSPSIYVDHHGEEDPSLRRGRPLFLNEARYRELETLWRQQGIPREVAQIRSTSDRVIRDNWY